MHKSSLFLCSFHASFMMDMFTLSKNHRLPIASPGALKVTASRRKLASKASAPADLMSRESRGHEDRLAGNLIFDELERERERVHIRLSGNQSDLWLLLKSFDCVKWNYVVYEAHSGYDGINDSQMVTQKDQKMISSTAKMTLADRIWISHRTVLRSEVNMALAFHLLVVLGAINDQYVLKSVRVPRNRPGDQMLGL